MHRTMSTSEPAPQYSGLRMTADAYLALPEDGHRYELIDGVICMSPSPSYKHQRIITVVASQIHQHIGAERNGAVVMGVDVKLATDLVYRPDLIYLSEAKASQCKDRVVVIPDVVVEVVSPVSGPYDRQTKFGDYERAGVSEYWIVDPIAKSFEFYQLRDGKYQEASPSEDAYASECISGFRLTLAPIRTLFK